MTTAAAHQQTPNQGYVGRRVRVRKTGAKGEISRVQIVAEVRYFKVETEDGEKAGPFVQHDLDFL